MGERFDRAVALDAAYHMRTYGRKPVLFAEGRGMRLYDDVGKEYLDFVSGIGAVNLGHSHPAVIEAVSTQMAKLTHVSNWYHVEHRGELAEQLVALLGGGMRVFFCNSGAEANEGAIKLARRWGKETSGDDRFKIVTAERSFHGRTLAALAATGQPAKQEAFAPLPPGFVHVPLNDTAALDAALDDSVCALMLEPIQGEGGVYACTEEYLKTASELCGERGILLVLDEVQTGFYRTGSAFAHHAFDVAPDVVCLAKAMANGLPIGAVAATEAVASAFGPGDHGSTFGGGPVVCAAARATISALATEDLGANAALVGKALRAHLDSVAERTGAIAEVRGVGLMAAAHLSAPVAVEVVAAALERGFVLNHVGAEIVRFLPPLVCGESEIASLSEMLEDVLRAAMEVVS